MASPNKGDVPQANELPRLPGASEWPDGSQGVTAAAAEASELPRPPEAPQGPDGPQGTAAEEPEKAKEPEKVEEPGKGKPNKWAEILSDGGDTGDDGCPKSGKPKLEEDRLRLEKLKLRICEFGGGQCVRAVKQMNLKPDAANIHGPEDRFRCGDCGGAVEKIACDSGYAGYFGCEGCDWVGEPSLPPPTKGKGKKGGTAGQQRARR